MRLSDLPNVEFFNTDKEHVQQIMQLNKIY